MKKASKKKVSKKKAGLRRTMPANLSREIDRRFDFVSDLVPEKTEACIRVRRAAKQMAKNIVWDTPVCREQSLALTKLEEALHFAIAAIVRPQGDQ